MSARSSRASAVARARMDAQSNTQTRPAVKAMPRGRVTAQEACAFARARGVARLAGAMLAFAIAAAAVPALGQGGAPALPPGAPHMTRGADAQGLIAWGTPEGLRRLGRTRHKATFAALANHFEPQQNKLFCGPATATIVLNALRLEAAGIAKPEDPRCSDPADAAYLPSGFNPVFARYTQDTFFTLGTDAVKTRGQVFGEPMPGAVRGDFGLQLRQLERMLRVHGLRAPMRIVDESISVALVRRELASALLDPGRFVIVNYHRAVFGQPGGGHISPVGAYDPGSDSFLVLDVNPNAAPWVWVPARVLVSAMRTRDGAENRGYVIVSEGVAASGAGELPPLRRKLPRPRRSAFEATPSSRGYGAWPV